MKRHDLLLYGITDSMWRGEKSLAQVVEQALKGGVTIIQYREKHLDYEKMKAEAIEVRNVCRKYGVSFIINDNVELAKEIDADGVHLGQSDMAVSLAREVLGENKIIGVTAKTTQQALKAESEGADYLGSGALFGRNTKKDAVPMSKELFNSICDSVNIPIVAIGGINLGNIEEIIDCKMDGVAVISGIFAGSDVEANARQFRNIMDARERNRICIQH